METLIINSNSKKDIQLIKEIALKFGMQIESKSNNQKTTKFDNLRVVAKRLDTAIKPNTIPMQEIVEECSIVRRKNNG